MRFIGAPMMWTADIIPNDTLVLDGSQLEVGDYWQLYAVYGRLYTPSAVPLHQFCLPDYRGLVVRGVDQLAQVDVDAKRYNRNGDIWFWGRTFADGTIAQSSGPTAERDLVGSIQKDSIRFHYHVSPAGGGGTIGASEQSVYPASRDAEQAGLANPTHASSKSTCAETRMDNIAVTFITYYQ